MTDTIAAIATAMGVGGIAIIRVSGPDAAAIGQRVFRGKPLSDHLFVYGRLIDAQKNPIDEGMAVLMRAPRSYTREDVLELHCHGGVHIARMVLEACFAAGARPAQPGEFTRRAYLNGRIDLAQAQGVMDMIAANSQASARAALTRIEGGLSRQIQTLEQALLDEAARLEAFLDYPDEDLEEVTARQSLQGIEPVITSLQSALRAAPAAQKRRMGVRVAIVGAPNAGKSSLLNALLGSERAIVSPIEGTTRDTLSESILIGGILFELTDTAGLRDASDAIEQLGVERARRCIEQADILLLCIDRAAPPPQEFLSLMSDPRTLIALNKDDLPPHPGHAFADKPVLYISARTGKGLEDLRQALLDASGTASHEDSFLTHAHDVQAATQALESLTAAKLALTQSSLDCAALDLRSALSALSAITGTQDEALLDRMFSTYCLGK